MANKLSQILEVFAPHHLYNTDLEDTRLSKPHSLKLNFRGIKEIDELPAFQLETYSTEALGYFKLTDVKHGYQQNLGILIRQTCREAFQQDSILRKEQDFHKYWFRKRKK